MAHWRRWNEFSSQVSFFLLFFSSCATCLCCCQISLICSFFSILALVLDVFAPSLCVCYLQRLHFQLNYRSKATHTSTSTCAAGGARLGPVQSSNNCITPPQGCGARQQRHSKGIARQSRIRYTERSTGSYTHTDFLTLTCSHSHSLIASFCFVGRTRQGGFQRCLPLSLCFNLPSTHTEKSFPGQKQKKNLPQLLLFFLGSRRSKGQV